VLQNIINNIYYMKQNALHIASVWWLVRIFFFFVVNWIVITFIVIFNIDIIIIFIDIFLSARAQNNIQLLSVNINKIIIENIKIWVFFQVNRKSNLIWFNQLTNLKDFISHTCVFVLILNNLDTTLGFCF